MTAAISHKGKQICAQCSRQLPFTATTEHAAHPANRPHLAAHWLPCPTHPDPEFLQHQHGSCVRNRSTTRATASTSTTFSQRPPGTRRPRHIPGQHAGVLSQRLRTRLRSPHSQRLVQRPVDTRRHRLGPRPAPTRLTFIGIIPPASSPPASTSPNPPRWRKYIADFVDDKYPPPTRHRRLGSCHLTRHPPLANQDAITFPPQIPSSTPPHVRGSQRPANRALRRGIPG